MSDFRTKEPATTLRRSKATVAIALVMQRLRTFCDYLDEATSMLDPKGRMEVIGQFKSYTKKKHYGHFDYT